MGVLVIQENRDSDNRLVQKIDYNNNSLMLEKHLPSRRQDLTPKITLTKTTITKSAPFFIRKHHLDDTEMKRALHYDQPTLKPNHQRRYSFKAELLTCQNSKLTAQNNAVVEYAKKIQAQRVGDSGNNEYYNVSRGDPGRNREVLIKKERQTEAPYFPNSGQRVVRAITAKSKGDRNQEPIVKNIVNKGLREIEKVNNRQSQNRYQQYGLKQIHSARKKMEKQAKKLRHLYKMKVQKNLQQIQRDQVIKLQQQIRSLKIQSLELKKQKYTQQLSLKLKQSNQKVQPALSNKQRLKYQRAQLILNKPRYRPSATSGDATDSSFSSFQLNSSVLSDT